MIKQKFAMSLNQDGLNVIIWFYKYIAQVPEPEDYNLQYRKIAERVS